MNDWLFDDCADANEAIRQQAIAHQRQLTKPAGSLADLEDIAIRLAALQGHLDPALERLWISIFAGDHGVMAENVSAYPQHVTAEMLRNFAGGGAAICVLARGLGAPLEVINLGCVQDPPAIAGVQQLALGPGTANFMQGAAMSRQQLSAALSAGRDSVERALGAGTQLYIGGEMGIGNSTSAAALACALLSAEPERLAGPGTGLNTAGVSHKVEVIRRALALHQSHLNNPLQCLRYLGGFEIAALTGAYIACAQAGIAVLVDGFICSAAALCAVRLNPGCGDWLFFAHQSAEPGHKLLLQALDAKPLLKLNLRLGEGSGAALAAPLMQQAVALHNQMATFASAGVSDKA
ncbi:nicotinate-nucleotide--dimethylbenzimidazole phosphoribosyltransferase [Atopomonas sediminilitoris]|uniref:nicotinate-nucleotide--dimethylbenzimidazole phosphoribosyltransferase n=1 Tax=Atopomonas sediminilitoris TaxID=2919919 RepID=UPI001F4E2D54|nr:nicotinate-nucleotide--dimethylbenzimidazole phosphoribosyltransferase [Atopomonas sediminilitoris]MCJ8170181.1 nicotinate-nucleotide--dimethylbenzimidazole phosphoribosyltransferase [Atopomonas sediminilitoris]